MASVAFTRAAALSTRSAIVNNVRMTAAASSSFTAPSQQPINTNAHYTSVAAAMAAMAALPTSFTPYSCIAIGGGGLYVPSPLDMPANTPLPAGLEQIVGDLEDDETGVDFVKRQYIPSFIKRKRTHGWRKRMSTPGGRAVIKRRVAKGRRRITV